MKKLITLLLAALFAFTLASCAPKDPASAKTNMEKKGYTVVVDGTVVPAGLKLAGAEGVQSFVTATKSVEVKKDDGSTEKTDIVVFAFWFDSSDNAKKSQKAIQDYATKNGSKSELKKAGNWLYYGDAQAMKDFA